MSRAPSPRPPSDPACESERGVVWLRRLLICVAGLLLALWLGFAMAFWTKALVSSRERVHDAARGDAPGAESPDVSLEVSVEINGVGAR